MNHHLSVDSDELDFDEADQYLDQFEDEYNEGNDRGQD